ncbi:ABC transporter ATP-binding protein/permease [Thermoclostridium stercorarium]|uniref:ABC transporter ATP-binding protein n=1 Tax=Thermoclostridium stercorarium TaxID=1510 RepID=UPI0022488EBC|nr:ABC transporter ATP-binding protein [Thermoclostridium stercorarium]UZQ85902.1 ABC transporter ATP-binding protein/permease [Thermoclostridium stercorarium]
MPNIKWLWGYLKKYGWMYGTGLLLLTFFSVLSLYVPQIMGRIVDEVIEGGRTELLKPLLLALIGATVFRTTLAYIHTLLQEKTSQNVIHDIRTEAYRRLNDQDFTFFDRNRTGDIMARMTGDMDAVRHFLAHVIPQFVKGTVTFVFAIWMMLRINVTFALCIFALMPVTCLITTRFGKEILPVLQEVRQQFSRLNTVVQENVSGHRVVKAFAREDFEINKFDKVNEDYRKANIKTARMWEKFLPPLDFMCNMNLFIILIVGGLFVSKGSITVGELVIFHGLAQRFNIPLRMIGWLTSDFQRFNASSSKIRELMYQEPKIKNVGIRIKNLDIKGKIEFRDVNFGYGDSHVLHDINFVIEPGQTAAFIGATGSGKSTIMNLILRFYETDEGLILVDGINVKNIDLKTLRNKISIAMQDVFLFTDTIEGNISYGVPNATFEDVKRVAEIAEADEFIRELPDGYDTIVGERGVGLSGGQKQRIALARTLLKNPDVLILDDTTSSLDLETEFKIQKALEKLNKKRTTLIITHRISSIMNADQIFVMDKGRIVERGTHEELLKKEAYITMYTSIRWAILT